VDKLGGSERSGSGSAAASPIPVTKSVSVVKLEELADVDLTAPSTGSLLQWNGARWVDVVGNLDLLADVDTTGAEAPTNGQALVYDSASGLWKPGTVSGGGSSAPASVRIDTESVVSTAPVSQTLVPGMTLTVTGGRTVLLSAGLTFKSTHAMRWNVWVNGVREWPTNAGDEIGLGVATDSSPPRYEGSIANLPVVLPAGSCTVEVRWSASGSTASVTASNRYLTLV
jgi:hypothetical protein